MTEEKRLKSALAFFRRLLSKPVCRYLHYEYDELPEGIGPYLLLSNHNMDVDPILIGLAAKHQLYFVATENVLRKKLLAWFLMRYFKPILHLKGKQGTKTVMSILRTLRRGDSAALFPEGNRSFNGVTGEIPQATTRMARRSGAALVTYRLEGGYLCQPRWGTSLRRGPLRGRLMHIYTPEEMKSMTEEALYAAVCADLHEDAYERQEAQPAVYHGKNPALGLESTVFACPKCGHFGTLKSGSRTVACDCGFLAEYDDYGYLTEPDGTRHTVKELDEIQRNLLLNRITAAAPGTLLFGDAVRASRIDEEHHAVEPREVMLAGTPEGFLVNGKPVTPAELSGAAIFSRNVLTVHLEDGRQYELRGDRRFNALKYYYLYQDLTEAELNSAGREA